MLEFIHVSTWLRLEMLNIQKLVDDSRTKKRRVDKNIYSLAIDVTWRYISNEADMRWHLAEIYVWKFTSG